MTRNIVLKFTFLLLLYLFPSSFLTFFQIGFDLCRIWHWVSPTLGISESFNFHLIWYYYGSRKFDKITVFYREQYKIQILISTVSVFIFDILYYQWWNSFYKYKILVCGSYITWANAPNTYLENRIIWYDILIY